MGNAKVYEDRIKASLNKAVVAHRRGDILSRDELLLQASYTAIQLHDIVVSWEQRRALISLAEYLIAQVKSESLQ